MTVRAGLGKRRKSFSAAFTQEIDRAVRAKIPWWYISHHKSRAAKHSPEDYTERPGQAGSLQRMVMWRQNSRDGTCLYSDPEQRRQFRPCLVNNGFGCLTGNA